MIHEKENIESILFVLNEAIKGFLELEEFYGLVEDLWELSEFFDKILSNTESAIEHVPSSIFNQEVDLESFVKSGEYRQMQIDIKLLESVLNGDEFPLNLSALEGRRILMSRAARY